MRARPDAFTLIELLTVMTIIAILAVLSTSAYTQVIAARNLAESGSRMRQWGTALGMYVADNDGLLPRRGQGVQPVTQLDRAEDWFNALPPYLGSPGYGKLVKTGRRPRENERSVFVRPGAKDPGTTAFLSYGMNMNLSPWNLSSATKMAAIERPSTTVFLAEAPGAYASTYPSKKPYSCEAPHNGKGNVLFLDGHVGAFTADYLGAKKGDPLRDDVHWLTGTDADAQAPNY